MVVHDCNKRYLQPLTKNSIFNLIFTIFREPKPPLHSGCKDRMLMHKKKPLTGERSLGSFFDHFVWGFEEIFHADLFEFA